MEFKFYNELCELLKDLFAELGFAKQEDGNFQKEVFAIKIDYDFDNKLVILKGAKLEEGNQLEFINLSSYLFDETHTEKDLKAVAIDFEETLRDELGAKRKLAATKVAMPKAEKGNEPNMEAFTKVFLDICPQYRDAYKEMVAENGKFLPINFYLKYGREKMLDLANNGTEKQISKFLSFLNKNYTEGEAIVVSTIATIILGGTFYNNKALFNEKILPLMNDMPYLKMAAVNAIDNGARNKKLKEMFA